MIPLSIAHGVLNLTRRSVLDSKGLPSVEKLKSGYDPPQLTRILAGDGTLLADVFTERRTVVLFADIPTHAKLA